MKYEEACDGCCRNRGCWPILTRWNVVAALAFNLLFLSALLYVHFDLMPYKFSLKHFFQIYIFETSFWLVVVFALTRCMLLGKLVSYFHSSSSLISKLLYVAFYLFIPSPDIQFLLSGEKAVTVRDFWLPEPFWDTPLITQDVKRRFFAQAYEEDKMIIIFLNQWMMVKVFFSEREMLFKVKLAEGIDPKQIVIPDTCLWTLDNSDGSTKLVYNEAICYFLEAEQLSDRIIFVVEDLERITF